MKNLFQNIKHKKVKSGGFILLAFLIFYFFALPKTLFNSPHSLVLESSNGELLGARIAEDGQWRFPHEKKVPEKFEKCITTFEDKRFYKHFGFDPLALGRAITQNLFTGRKVSGASTLSMQVIRLSRKNPPRTLSEKLLEIILATRLEFAYSKKEILAFYTSNAPFGGNIVGLPAASWRYFGRPAETLSWGETATLAVLPNSPALVYPGRNTQTLLNKRNRLLQKLRNEEIIDSVTCTTAQLEPLPDKPFPLPMLTPHLLDKIYIANHKTKNNKQEENIVKTSIDIDLQYSVNKIIDRHFDQLNSNGIHNAAALVLDVETGKVLAYTGNTSAFEDPEKNCNVDNISAPRSTGSILKPFLYASMLNDGLLLPEMLVPDVPTYINSYTPKNFNFQYDGAVPADKALARSLNIPAVHMLQSYTPQNFAHQLQKMGITTLHKPGNYYGLSLILGGAEATLWDLAGVYASMARTLNHYNTSKGKYFLNDFHLPDYKTELINSNSKKIKDLDAAPVLSASSIWLTLEAMVKVARPDEEKFWKNFDGARKIAWKTGTSFGNRDAWAIGCTPKYVVAVWVGNSNGEGRPGLTGISSAAPVLFDIFNKLPEESTWFSQPFGDMQKVFICNKSGQIATNICPEKTESWISKNNVNVTLNCPYHCLINLDENEKFQVHSDCEAVSKMVQKSWFILPATEESYYKQKHPDYAELPPFRNDCSANLPNSALVLNSMKLVYPQNPTKIYLPVDFSGKTGSTVFEVTHRNSNAVIYWNIDEKYVGRTQSGASHQLAFSPSVGKHNLILIDDNGERLEQSFEIVVSKQKK